jgi:hypothetical protein
MPFETWGTRTDGERTPWVEWHDIEKVRRRLHPAILKTVLDCELASHNFRWIDLEYAGMGRTVDATKFIDLKWLPVVLDGGDHVLWNFAGQAGAFFPIGRMDLREFVSGLTPPFAVELALKIAKGVVSVGFVDANNQYLPDAELILEAAPDWRMVTIRCTETPAFLVFRNRHADHGSEFFVSHAHLKEA